MYYRATNSDLGDKTVFDNGRKYGIVEPEHGPLIQYIDDNGNFCIRPESVDTVCFSASPEGAIIGLLSVGEPSEETVYVYRTEQEPDLDLRDSPGVIEDEYTMETEYIERAEFDFDLIEEVRYENPNVEAEKWKKVEIPPQVRQIVSEAYDEDVYREKVKEALRIMKSNI